MPACRIKNGLVRRALITFPGEGSWVKYQKLKKKYGCRVRAKKVELEWFYNEPVQT